MQGQLDVLFILLKLWPCLGVQVPRCAVNHRVRGPIEMRRDSVGLKLTVS